jgi:hypothetical protein
MQTASFEMCEININTAQRDDQNQHHGIKVCDQCQNDDAEQTGGVEQK